MDALDLAIKNDVNVRYLAGHGLEPKPANSVLASRLALETRREGSCRRQAAELAQLTRVVIPLSPIVSVMVRDNGGFGGAATAVAAA